MEYDNLLPAGIFDIPEQFRLYQDNFLTTPDLTEEQEEVIDPIGITPQQLQALYPLNNMMAGGDNNNTNVIDTTNNAGINSFKDLRNYAIGLPAAAKIGSLAFGPLGFIGGLLGTSIADKLGLTQKGRDRKAAEEARERGIAKQRTKALEAMRGPIGRDGEGPSGGHPGGAAAAAGAAAQAADDSAAGAGGY